jgi:hypothetical protein
MCIYGVTQIGADSIGISRILPDLLTALQIIKPVLVFLSGLWFVLYLINRRTGTAPLTGRILALLALLGMFAVADAGIESAYLVIPKKEEPLSGGCCSMAFDRRATRSPIANALGDQAAPVMLTSFYLVNLGMALALTLRASTSGVTGYHAWCSLLLFGSLLSIVVNLVFLIEVASPRLLHLPHHHCPYDLVEQAPQGLLPIVTWMAAGFLVGWGCLAAWLGNSAESRSYLPAVVKRLFRLAVFGYLVTVIAMSLELAY